MKNKLKEDIDRIPLSPDLDRVIHDAIKKAQLDEMQAAPKKKRAFYSFAAATAAAIFVICIGVSAYFIQTHPPVKVAENAHARVEQKSATLKNDTKKSQDNIESAKPESENSLKEERAETALNDSGAKSETKSNLSQQNSRKHLTDTKDTLKDTTEAFSLPSDTNKTNLPADKSSDKERAISPNNSYTPSNEEDGVVSASVPDNCDNIESSAGGMTLSSPEDATEGETTRVFQPAPVSSYQCTIQIDLTKVSEDAKVMKHYQTILMPFANLEQADMSAEISGHIGQICFRMKDGISEADIRACLQKEIYHFTISISAINEK